MPRKRKKAKASARQEQQFQRHEQILRAAFDVFATHGFEAARLDDVARKAGVAKGTIYLYFPDKERLFQAVVRNLIPKRLDLLVKSLPGSPTELLRVLLSQIYSDVVRNEKVRAIVQMLVAESGRFPQLAEIYHQEIIARGMAAMRQALAKGMANGEFRKSEVFAFPQIVVAPALLAIMWQLLFSKRHPLDLEAYMNAHVEFVLAGLQRGQE